MRSGLFRSFGLLTVLGSVILPWFASPASADTWRGTAPFCDGKCNSGEEQIGSSRQGDGGYCVTGHKALCRNSSPQCLSKDTVTHCYGVVEICQNGYYESLNSNFHECNSYACGVCFGTSSLKLTTDTCQQGYVWREGIKNDHVCVTPAVRTSTAADNRSAASHHQAGGGAYGPDTCKQGFVWREIVLTDHVCVTPATRAAVALDNSMATKRVASQSVMK